ncbi:MAG: EFR1 family ferrodoxin [Candidatus Marinimicrobia bacterium]|nr:EFR1 family ferrodoxin [Candidatus Neomarinimicrobiota bacterium]
MGTEIYYFTGTGNSLFVAKTIAEKIGDSKVISIPKVIKQDTIDVSGMVGIVCPIYMYNMPLIVVDFIKKIKRPEYLFIVFAGGGETGNCIKLAQKLCESRQIELSSAFNIKMPSNYTPFGATPEKKQQEYLSAAFKKIEEIAQIVNSKTKYIEKSSTGFLKSNLIPGLFYQLGYKFIRSLAKSYFADEKCNGCAICQKVCPVDNIRIANGKPVWNSHCQQCYACLQWCPQEAIQSGKKTARIKRYRNPYVKVNEIIESAR